MIDWNEFTQLVRQAHIAQGDEDLDDTQRQHAATFAAIGLAVLTLRHEMVARLEASSNQPLVISSTGGKLV